MRSPTDPTPRGLLDVQRRHGRPQELRRQKLGATSFDFTRLKRPLGPKASLSGARRSGSYPRSTTTISPPPSKVTPKKIHRRLASKMAPTQQRT
ncbi:hypothetical protein GBA52_028910 [Prunus armeniaca]|nr:hypothetical protein GBA52_028910 [Prunus armeniaca]